MCDLYFLDIRVLWSSDIAVDSVHRLTKDGMVTLP